MLNIPENRKYDAVTLGRLAIDINPANMDESFADCLHFKKYVGGSPANTAVGLARLGAKTGMICKISQDSLGNFARDYIAKCGVDTTQVYYADKEIPIGLAFTEILNGGTNLMMYRTEKAADLLLTTEEIDEEYIKNTRLIVISGTALSASPSREAAFKALELAKKHGCCIVFDIDYRGQNWKSFDEISVYYTLAANYAHIIMGSREEYDLMDKLAVNGEESDIETANRWFAKNAEICIIKHGKEGSMAYVKDGRQYQIDIVKVNALKSTGGGDAYSCAFLYGLLNGYDLKKCFEMATAHASLAVAHPSCSEAMVELPVLLNTVEAARERQGEFVIEK